MSPAERDPEARRDDERARLRRELEAVPRGERMDYLANLPPDRLVLFKRILPREDIRKLNQHVDRVTRQRAKPTYEKWIAEARAGRATSADAMVEVLKENLDRLRDQDATWIRRITDTCPGGSYSRRQEEVIRSIYARYYGSQTG